MSQISRDSTFGFVGSGAVGTSLAVSFSNHGYRVVAASSRTSASAQRLANLVPGCKALRTAQEVADVSDIVFITTSDDAIGPVASSLSWRIGQGAIHCSGAASINVFESAVNQGAIAGAFHPIQAISSTESGVKNIPGTTFGIEGSPEMQVFLENLALSIEGNPVFLKAEDKPLYHLTGVMMGGLLTTLAAVAAQLWEEFGIDRDRGVEALAVMMRGVSNNLEAYGLPSSVAGPYARGDIGTVRKHLDTLSSRAPGVLSLYCELALAGLPFCVEKGTLDPKRSEEIRELVNNYKDGAI